MDEDDKDETGPLVRDTVAHATPLTETLEWWVGLQPVCSAVDKFGGRLIRVERKEDAFLVIFQLIRFDGLDTFLASLGIYQVLT